MAVVGGVVGYLGVFFVLAASMALAGRGVGRLVGLRAFRWFSADRTDTAWWRLFLVRLAAAAAPWVVSAVLFGAHYALHGDFAPRAGAYVEVRPGPARQAGMRDGDRVVRVGEREIHDWDELRAVVSQHTAPVDIEVQRGSERRTLRVTPEQGRIGVALQLVNQPLGAAEVAKRALSSPGAVVRASARALLRTVRGAEKSELRGPVGVVREIGTSDKASVLILLASLCAYAWPLLVGVVLFEVATGAMFRVTYPEAPSNASRGFQLARWQQALLLSTSAYVVALPMLVLAALEVPGAPLLIVWVMPVFASCYPLIWLAGSDVWPRPAVVLALVGALFVPCVALLVPLALLRSLRLALEKEGFRFGWLRSVPPAPSEAAAV